MIFSILIFIVCILLILVIMVQDPKGGILNSSLTGGSNQFMSVGSTENFIEKITWFLCILLVVLVITLNLFIKNSKQSEVGNTKLNDIIDTELYTPNPNF